MKYLECVPLKAILDPVRYEGHIGITASIILPLFLLHVYVCFAVIFEEPLIEKYKENI